MGPFTIDGFVNSPSPALFTPYFTGSEALPPVRITPLQSIHLRFKKSDQLPILSLKPFMVSWRRE